MTWRALSISPYQGGEHRAACLAPFVDAARGALDPRKGARVVWRFWTDSTFTEASELLSAKHLLCNARAVRVVGTNR